MLARVTLALENFKRFNSGNKVKQAALGFMIQHFMTQKEAQELSEAFKQLDTDGSGALSKEELIEGYRAIHGDAFDKNEIDELLNMADANDDGVLDYADESFDAVVLYSAAELVTSPSWSTAAASALTTSFGGNQSSSPPPSAGM